MLAYEYGLVISSDGSGQPLRVTMVEKREASFAAVVRSLDIVVPVDTQAIESVATRNFENL